MMGRQTAFILFKELWIQGGIQYQVRIYLYLELFYLLKVNLRIEVTLQPLKKNPEDKQVFLLSYVSNTSA